MSKIKKLKKIYFKLVKKIKNQKKYYLGLVAALVFIGIFAFSVQKGKKISTSNNNCEEVCKFPSPAPSPTIEAYNSSARIKVCGCNCFVTGSYLYWQAREKGVELAERVSVESSTHNNKVIPMHFDYHSAFKVGFGFYSKHDNWSLFSQYTRFYCKNSSHKSLDNFNSDPSPLSNQLRSAWFHNTDSLSAYAFREAKSRWKLHLNLIDLELSRPFFVGTKLIFKPFIGAKGGLINQRYLFEGTLSINTPVEPNPSDVSAFSRSFSKSWLIGPRMGLDTNWMLGAGFRLFGNGAINLFYQHFKTNIKQGTVSENLPESFEFVGLSREKCAYFNSSFESLLGFGWGSYLNENKWHLDLSAGYEIQLFLNQNMFRSLMDQTSNSLFPDGTSSNLMLHGLTLSGKIDF